MPKANGNGGKVLARINITVRENASGERFVTYKNRSTIGGLEKSVSYRVPVSDSGTVLDEAKRIIASAAKDAPEPAQRTLGKK